MAFRSDLEATRRRAAALEEELDSARVEVAEGRAAKERVAALEEQLKQFQEAETSALAEAGESDGVAPPAALEKDAGVDLEALAKRLDASSQPKSSGCTGFLVAALIGMIASAVLAQPHHAGHWGYIVVAVVGGGVAGALLLSAWREYVDWSDIFSAQVGVVLLFSLFGVFGIRTKGDGLQRCKARRAHEITLPRHYAATVAAAERIEGVSVGARCEVSVSFVHSQEDVCSRACDLSVGCGEKTLVVARGARHDLRQRLPIRPQRDVSLIAHRRGNLTLSRSGPRVIPPACRSRSTTLLCPVPRRSFGSWPNSASTTPPSNSTSKTTNTSNPPF